MVITGTVPATASRSSIFMMCSRRLSGLEDLLDESIPPEEQGLAPPHAVSEFAFADLPLQGAGRSAGEIGSFGELQDGWVLRPHRLDGGSDLRLGEPRGGSTALWGWGLIFLHDISS